MDTPPVSGPGAGPPSIPVGGPHPTGCGPQVLSHGAEPPRMLAVNRLDDSFSASAALVGRELFLRGERYLYCLAEE